MEYTLANSHQTLIYQFNTSQFKTSTICLVMNLPLNEDDYLHGLILKRLLLKKTAKFNTPLKLASRLRDLYDMRVDIDNLSSGDLHTLLLRVSFIDSYYVEEDTNLENEAVDVIEEILFNPALKANGQFNEEDVEVEKRAIIDEISSVYNRKMAYAFRKLIHIMYKDTNIEVLLGDKIERINTITSESLIDFYQKLISKSSIYFVTMGKLNNQLVCEKVSNLIENHFNKNYINNYDNISVLATDDPTCTTDFTKDTVKTNQSVLAMGFTTDIRTYDEDYPAMIIANGMFGGYFHSELFQIIREKYNFAYAISSSYNSINGSIIVIAGVDNKNMVKAKELTLDILNQFKEGALFEQNFELTKTSIISELLQSEDSRYTQLLLLKSNIDFKDRFLTNTELIEKIKVTTYNDVINVFKKINLCHTYFLEGNSEMDGETDA